MKLVVQPKSMEFGSRNYIGSFKKKKKVKKNVKKKKKRQRDKIENIIIGH